MSRRGTKRQRHLAHFLDTGQMTEWLARRLEWDRRTSEEITDVVFDRPIEVPLYTLITSVYNPRAWCHITGLTVLDEVEK